eukprot:3675563-Lingulodinium_polyedra.AAC.1
MPDYYVNWMVKASEPVADMLAKFKLEIDKMCWTTILGFYLMCKMEDSDLQLTGICHQRSRKKLPLPVAFH